MSIETVVKCIHVVSSNCFCIVGHLMVESTVLERENDTEYAILK